MTDTEYRAALVYAGLGDCPHAWRALTGSGYRYCPFCRTVEHTAAAAARTEGAPS